MKGPHLIGSLGRDQEIFSYYTFEELTGIALNRTTVMLVGGNIYNSHKGTYHRDKIFTLNIQNKIWTKYSDLPSNWYDLNKDELKIVAALSFEKDRKRYRFFQR